MELVAGNVKKSDHKTVNLRKATFKKLNNLAADRMKITEGKETADSVTSFLLEFYETHKQQA